MSAVIKQDLDQHPLGDTPLCSGFGQYHTDSPTSPTPKPYRAITLNDVFNMAEHPQKVDKSAAQWVIFSDLMTRESSKQSADGIYYAVWCDFDNPTELQAIKDVLANLFCDYVIYSSRSATEQHQKWRVIIPLATPASATDWQPIAAIINDKFEQAGIVPDRASERVNQICYLPNRGDFYQFHIANDYEPLDWKTALSAELIEKQNQAKAEQSRLDRLRESSRLKAVERMATGSLSPIDAYNAAYSIDQSLEFYGYKRVGKKYLSPNSESGAAGVTVKGDKWLSSHSSDAGIGQPNNSGGGTHGDSFDLFTYYEHGGNRNAAIRAAGAMFTTSSGNTLSKANQRAFMEQNSAAKVAPVTPAKNESVTTIIIDGTEYPDHENRPCYLTHENGFKNEKGQWCKAGTYLHSSKTDKEGSVTLTDTWICSPLIIESVTLDQHHNNYGRFLRYKPTRGRWRKWCMPMALLSGTGDALRAELLNKGVLINLDNQKMLPRYLTHFVPRKTLEIATQTGWHKGAYILPESCIGSDDYFYQSENVHTDVPYRQQDTLEQWQQHIARYCVGNPLLMLSVCCAFAGALLKPSRQQGGGFHFVGESSKGKSTGLEVACSVHGDGTYKHTWKATGNGMEATAAMFNDGFLALDEIGECNPKEVGSIIYQVANGVGKSRANRNGGAKASYQWLVMVMSNGEVSIESAMQEAGQRAKAGQLMRLLNIPIFGKYGAFNDLHDKQDGRALADHLKTASLNYYGAAGIDYLTKLVAEQRDIAELAERYTVALIDGEPLSSQESRAAKRFALVALAGELATEYGITGWTKGDACHGVKECFKQWRKSFGGGDTEDRQIKEAVQAYVEMYGDARFTSTTDDTRLHGIRSGYWKDGGTHGREWLFSKSGLMEATKGYDLKKAVSVLKGCGFSHH
jgi:putative DNA primase/helicase